MTNFCRWRRLTTMLVLLAFVLVAFGCAGGKKVPRTDLIPFLANESSLWAVDASGELYRSADLGHTFTRVTPPGWFKPVTEGESASYAIARTMYESEPPSKQAWLVDGADNLHRTYNGGKSWKNLGKVLPERSFYPGRMPMAFSDALHGWLQTTAGLYRSNDGGKSWELLNEYKSDDVNSLAFVSNQKGFQGRNDGLYRTDNGGKDWSAVPLGRKGLVTVPNFFGEKDGILTMIDSEKQERVYFTTRNSGESWEQMTYPQPQQEEFYFTLSFYKQDEGYLVFMTPDASQYGMGVSRLLHTADRGESWSEVELSEPLNGFPLFSSAENGVVFESGTNGVLNIKETVDGGKTWIPFTPLVKE